MNVRWVWLGLLVGCAEDPSVRVEQDGLVTISGPQSEADFAASPPPASGLRVSEVVPGAPLRVTIVGGAPGDRAALFGGAPGRTCFGPGLCVDIANASALRVGVFPRVGAYNATVPVPAGMPVGVSKRFQGGIDRAGLQAFTPSQDVTFSAPSVCPGASDFQNPGFEDTFGPPWMSDTAPTRSRQAAEGAVAMELNGNHYLQQDVPYVPVSALRTARLGSWHDAADAPAMAIEWTYSDGTTGLIVLSGPALAGWQAHDLLPSLDVTKELASLRVWGYSGGGAAPDITRFDGFAFCW